MILSYILVVVNAAYFGV